VSSSLGNSAANTANGGLAVSLLESNVTATLHALAVNNKIDVLSRPYILASDNQQATMTVGQVVPYISESRLDENDNTINTVTYADVGIILTVTAHINPDGLVTMNVQPQISDEASTSVAISNGVTSPVFDLRSAQTYVAIRDGQTIVIGGLMQDEKTSTITKVPLLGSLPLIGTLFQRNMSERIKTELLIFLTPHAVPNAGVLKPMSEDELRGLKLTPSAVEPGAFDEHMRGLQRGTTQPTNEYSPSDDATAPQTPGGLR
jgi:general secretion pathway protein D